MNQWTKYGWAFLSTAPLLIFTASAHEPRSSFDGLPTETATLANGAIIRADYLRHSQREGAGRIERVGEKIFVLRNYSIVNAIVVETDEGLVVMDTGTNRAEGLKFAELIQKLSNKPLLAIIYSHNHYTGGAEALRTLSREPGNLLVVGHPKLEENFKGKSLDLRPSTSRRVNMQFGRYLPATGPDARIAPASTPPANAEDGIPQHIPVNRTVADGEILQLGGMEFQFFHAEGDTDDSLTVYIPELSSVLTNVISQQFFALSTLRGQPYREPRAIIASYDKIRDLAPEHYIPTHGPAISGKGAVVRRMQIHRDAYSFTYNQAIRGINRGLSPGEIVLQTPFPEHFKAEPSLYEGYSEYEYALRGIYSGLIGWFAEDTAELHPPSPQSFGAAIVQGFGGSENLLRAAREAHQHQEWNLAASLASYAVYADPDDQEARQVKAEALRQMARVSSGLQSHNFYLTEALELEGKINTREVATNGHGGFGFATVAGLPPATLVTVLESRIDPAKSLATDQKLSLHFSDVPDGTFLINVRRGVAEVREGTAADNVPILEISRKYWFDLLTRQRGVGELPEDTFKLTGLSLTDLDDFLSLFDPL